MKKQLVHFFATGGTIDSYWNHTDDVVSLAGDDLTNGQGIKHYLFDQSPIRDHLFIVVHFEQYKFTRICAKNSNDIGPADLNELLKAIKESEAKKIVITHGVNTINRTAMFLEENLQGLKKTVVLTGAHTPIIGFYPTDAPFNLGYATGVVENKKSGVYICLWGRIYKSNEQIVGS